ncbi:MAG: DotU family type IV/VI secretion system protein [Acidobacteria bacterium]|nr:DotU family type IV/VI secretion system protein [Acidobacteriota bacterium]
MTPGGFGTTGAQGGGPRKQENLALCYQELLVVGERLRTGRQQVSDSPTFRQQLLGAIEMSADAARKQGYAQEDVELATFAVIAFLDESILNLRSPVFADWPKQPLQEQRYGHHIAGEIFFKNLANLLGRGDSHDLADILEVYYLCLLLGFAGRYSLGGKGDLYAIQQQTGDKIQRIRRTPPELSPYWMLPNDNIVKSSSDPWVKTLLYASIGLVVLTAVLFGVYKFLLGSGIDTMANLAKGVI